MNKCQFSRCDDYPLPTAKYDLEKLYCRKHEKFIGDVREAQTIILREDANWD